MSGGFSNKPEFPNELTASEILWVQSGDGGVVLLAETTAPTNTSGYGKVYVKQSDHKVYYLDEAGNEYPFILGDGVSMITVASSAPSSPSTGDLWVDTS